jgi:hypothetical protein
MKPETLKKIKKGLDDLRDKVAAEVEEDRKEKEETLRLFALLALIMNRPS